MKVPPLIINLKNIEKHKKSKKHKKHKKHHKHHNHHHNQQNHRHLPPENPPLLEPVDFQPDFEEPASLYPINEPIAQPDPPAPEPTVPEPPTLNSPTPEPLESFAPSDLEPALEPPELKPSAPGPPDTTEAVVDPPAPKSPDEISLQDAGQSPLRTKRPEASSKISFLRMADDGSVTMAIIGPKKAPPEDSTERALNLEQLCGPLSEGTDVIPTDIDEEEFRELLQVKPVDFVEPTTFGSYLPCQDSTFANLTKDDSETLIDIWGGNPTCYEYATSLQDYAKGTNYLMTMVDSLLDLLTDGKHRKEAVPIRERIIEKEKEAAQEKVAALEKDRAPEKVVAVEENVVAQEGEKTSQENGFKPDETQDKMEVDDPKENDDKVENQEQKEDNSSEDEIQTQLDAIDSLLNELKDVQERRLSASAAPIEPDEEESKLAEEVLSKMTRLIKEKAKPGEICHSAAIFKALGI